MTRRGGPTGNGGKPFVGHREKQVPYCGRCKGRNLELVSNYIIEVKWAERVQVRCLDCSHVWQSENAALVARAKENAKC